MSTRHDDGVLVLHGKLERKHEVQAAEKARLAAETKKIRFEQMQQAAGASQVWVCSCAAEVMKMCFLSRCSRQQQCRCSRRQEHCRCAAGGFVFAAATKKISFLSRYSRRQERRGSHDGVLFEEMQKAAGALQGRRGWRSGPAKAHLYRGGCSNFEQDRFDLHSYANTTPAMTTYIQKACLRLRRGAPSQLAAEKRTPCARACSHVSTHTYATHTGGRTQVPRIARRRTARGVQPARRNAGRGHSVGGHQGQSCGRAQQCSQA
eukprot:scaffold159852_cov18-Tisochrysis_lutea.AAC.1